MVVVNRLLRVVAALRVACLYHGKSCAEIGEFAIPLADYGLTRSFLMGLAITPTHSSLSPYAVDTAEILYKAIVLNANYQLTVPSHSELGKKLFTRRDAEQITGLSYNTVKSHMSELEDEGILESTRVESKREKGKQIFFRFNGHPPFGVAALYKRLPSQDTIAADDSGLQETNAILTSTGKAT
jgi:DNA-binding transcriptional ArsR family regulator